MPSPDAARIHDMVRGLEQTDRYIVFLFFADQLTPREIALVMEVSVPRVEATLESFRRDANRALGAPPTIGVREKLRVA